MGNENPNRMKVHQGIAKAIVDHGVEVLFGLIGDANLYAVDSYVRDHGGRYIAAANENGAVLMALAYAQATRRIGVATVTHGPALTNTLTALVEGVKGSIPMVLLAGDTAVEAREHLQNVNQREFILATGAGFEQMRSPATMFQDISTAFRRAALECRPIVLNMPADFQWLDVDYKFVPIPLSAHRTAAPEGDELDKAGGIIASAKRPVVVGGRGAVLGDAREALIRLADRIDAPLATTLKGKGLFEGHPFNLGVFGTLSHDAASEIIGEADCVIAFGAGLNDFTTAEKSLLKGKRVVQVNLEREAVGRFAVPDAGLVGDPAKTADLLVALLDAAEIPGSAFRSDDMREKLAKTVLPDRVPGAAKDQAPGTVDVRLAMSRLNAALPQDRLVTTDAGRFVYTAWRYLTVAKPGAFIYMCNQGAIGLGVASAVGIAASDDTRPTLLITGDGGFMLGGLTELSTAVRHKQDLVIILLNDGSYGAEYIQFETKSMNPDLSLLEWPDFAPVAQSLGATGVTVRSEADLDAAVAAIRDRKGVVLVDVKVDPRHMPVG